MNEPKRWLNDGAPPEIGQVLRAAGSEQPSSGSLERALASVALGAGVTGAATSAAGAAGVASSSGIFLKWTLLGCAVTLGTVGAGLGLGVLDDAASAPKAAPAVARPAPTAGSDQTPPAPAAAADLVDERTSPEETPASAPRGKETEPRRHADAPQPAPVVPIEDVDLLAQETRFIERARAESAAGRASAAVAALDEYERRFPVRRYGPEALYLRMEALIALGEHAAARQVATRLATTFPNSPHAARAEAVRGAKIP